MVVVGICENGFLGQTLISEDPSVSIEDCEKFLRNLLGYEEFRVFQNYEDFENARLEELKAVRNFTVILSSKGAIKRVFYNDDYPEEPEEPEDWIEVFDSYEDFSEFNGLDCYERVLRKAETDEGREFLKGLGWNFVEGGHYPF